MVQATGKSSGHSVKKIRAFREMLRSFREISHFSSQTSTLILPTILFYFKKFWGVLGAQNAPKKSKNDQIWSPTFEIVPIFGLYINFAVVPTLLMTHFMKYIYVLGGDHRQKKGWI